MGVIRRMINDGNETHEAGGNVVHATTVDKEMVNKVNSTSTPSFGKLHPQFR